MNKMKMIVSFVEKLFYITVLIGTFLSWLFVLLMLSYESVSAIIRFFR